MNHSAIQLNYLLKQIYISGGNMFQLLSANHHQALHSFQTACEMIMLPVCVVHVRVCVCVCAHTRESKREDAVSFV
jgi:hypothetical protein